MRHGLLAMLGSALVAVAGCGSDPAERASPVTVSPASPGPGDVVTVRARTLHGRGSRGDGSNYHFHLAGPTGPSCADRFHSAIGMFGWERRATERGGEVVIRRYYPTDDRDPLIEDGDRTRWCPGSYAGAVEWRGLGPGDRHRRRRLPNGIEIFGNLVGTYSFEIPG